MQHIFKRVVVLLSDLKNIDNLLKKASDFSRHHQTGLEILYVQEEALFDIPDYFLSEDKIANECLDKKSVKAKIEEHLLSLGIEDKHAILVYEGDTVDQVLHYAKEQKEILFITAYHEVLSDKLVEKTAQSFWIVKKDIEYYEHIVLPLDCTEQGKQSLEISKHIFPVNRMSIIHDYRYLLDTLTVQVDYLNLVPVVSPEIIEFNEKLKKEQKEKFEDYQKEFGVQGEFMEADGSLDQDLINYISKNNFDLTIMSHQDSEYFLSPSLIVELLKELESDFFIINL
jgi:predicted transcriptional regulator